MTLHCVIVHYSIPYYIIGLLVAGVLRDGPAVAGGRPCYMRMCMCMYV